MKQLLNSGWRFRAEGAGGRQFNRHVFKNGEAKGCAAEKFNDSDWKDVTLPHDWCYSLSQDPDYNVSHGHYKLNTSDSLSMDPVIVPEDSGTPIGWYRKRFTLPADYSDKLVYLEFEGIFRDSEIYVNGTFIGRHMSGYTGMRFEISDVLYFDGRENVVAVRVDCTQNEGWFYEGAGIYRNAFLDVRERVSIAPDSVFVKSIPVFDNDKAISAQIDVSCEIVNETDIDRTVSVSFSTEEQTFTTEIVVPSFGKADANGKLRVNNPRVWDVDTPELCEMTTTVACGNLTDTESAAYGVRSIRFDPDEGFFLNGRRLEIRGACLHQDFACVGSALTYELHEYKIRRLREMGCNAIRTSHNAPAPELLEACDKLGMMVMDETRMFGSSDEAVNEMTSIVRRDRNHPSVILWSIGNEEHTRQNNDNGRRIAKRMIREVRRLDASRPITYGGNNGGQYEGINETVDVRGFNYLHIGAHDYIEKYHADHPEQPIVGSEEASSYYNRGEVHFDAEKRAVGGYDKWMAPWGSSAGGWLRYLNEHRYIAGAFMWTGFDYSGEPSPFLANSVTSFGAIDLCGYAKDVYYYYKSWWRDEDELHLFPDWNRVDGEIVRVAANTNLDEVELFLNGVSLGRKKNEFLGHVEWEVTFKPGKLEAVGFRGGKEVMRAQRVTTGAPARLALRVDQSPGRTGTALVTAEILDKNGNIVPYASDKIFWKVDNGEILGLGNGDPKSFEKNQYDKIRIRRQLGGFRRKLGSEWIPYDTTGEPDSALFTMNDHNTEFPEPVTDHFRDDERIILRGGAPVNTTTELACEFDDKGGNAMIVFERVEGKAEISLNGAPIATLEGGLPQAVRVTLDTQNTLNIKLTARDSLEALKRGVFIDRYEEPEMFRKAFHGLCMTAVRCNENTTVSVSADGLEAAQIRLSV